MASSFMTGNLQPHSGCPVVPSWPLFPSRKGCDRLKSQLEQTLKRTGASLVLVGPCLTGFFRGGGGGSRIREPWVACIHPSVKNPIHSSQVAGSPKYPKALNPEARSPKP